MVSSRITSFFAYWITTETSALVVSFFRYKSLFEEGKKRTESLRISPVYSIFDARYIKKTLSKDLNRERERERERDTLGRGNIFPHSIKFHPIFPLITTTAKRGWPQSRKSSQSYKSQLEYVSNRNYIFFIRLLFG